jgi:hypothetical protein
MSPAFAFTVTEIERILEPVFPDPFIASFEAMAMMRRCQHERERLPDDSTTRALSSSAHERSDHDQE